MERIARNYYTLKNEKGEECVLDYSRLKSGVLKEYGARKIRRKFIEYCRKKGLKCDIPAESTINKWINKGVNPQKYKKTTADSLDVNEWFLNFLVEEFGIQREEVLVPLKGLTLKKDSCCNETRMKVHSEMRKTFKEFAFAGGMILAFTMLSLLIAYLMVISHASEQAIQDFYMMLCSAFSVFLYELFRFAIWGKKNVFWKILYSKKESNTFEEF